MIRKCLAGVLILLFVTGVSAHAQDDDIRSTVEYKIDKMRTTLQLTDAQAESLKPIVKNYLVKREAILQEVAGEGIVDHVSVKATLKALKENEYQLMSKILSQDQMEKWINKENLMATLNPDSTESAVDDSPTLGANGANFKF